MFSLVISTFELKAILVLINIILETDEKISCPAILLSHLCIKTMQKIVQVLSE